MTELERKMDLLGRPLNRPVDVGELTSPRLVRVDGDYLVYDPYDHKPVRWAQSRGALLDFLRLAESNPAAVARFCRRYGMPILCEHGLPPGHGSWYSGTKKKKCAFPMPYGLLGEKAQFPERSSEEIEFALVPVSAIQRLARCFGTLVTIASELHQGRAGTDEDWLFVQCALLGDSVPSKDWVQIVKSSLEWTRRQSNADIHVFRMMYETEIETLIVLSRLRPAFRWDVKTSTWKIDFVPPVDSAKRWPGNSNLFATLTSQLLIVIADKEGYAVCSNCHRTYIPSRTPARDRRSYCQRDACAIHARQRDAQRDRRAGVAPRWRRTTKAKKR